MERIILTADHSLMTEFRNISLFGFFSCSPVQYVPELFYDRLFAPLVPADNGNARYAQYGLRKVEASLIKAFGRKSVVVAHPRYLSYFADDASIIGLTVMDPLGIGPVTSSFAFGTGLTPYNRKKFMDLLKTIRKKIRCRVIAGGGGAWQLVDKDLVDHVLVGEFEKDGPEVIKDIMDGCNRKVFKLEPPEPEEIPPIVGPSINGLVEVSRGCPRKCNFCDPTTHRKRDIPIEQILKEVRLNARYGQKSAWLHAEDILLYRCESKNFEPNKDAVIELFKEVMKVKGVKSAGTTHCSLAGVVAAPEIIEKVTEITGKGWHGVQPGIETGSPKLIKKYMKNKPKPFSAEEWPEIVEEAISILNRYKWLPACTLILGLPGETEDDVLDTIRLVERLDRFHCVLAPLFYVPLGALRTKGKMFSIKSASPEHLRLIYECWKHNLREFSQGVWKGTSEMNPLFRIISSLLVKIGSREILRRLEKYLEKCAS